MLTLLPLLLAATAAAAPVDSVCRPIRTTLTAKYDDIPFLESGAKPIPPYYYGLSYTGFQVDQYDGFIKPSSGNQWAMSYGGLGNFSVPESPLKQTLDLTSFSYACVAGIPQSECAINVWGVKADGKVIAKSIVYPKLDPGHAPSDFKMNSTTLGSEWSGLKSVGFAINLNGGLALDDVRYDVVTGC